MQNFKGIKKAERCKNILLVIVICVKIISFTSYAAEKNTDSDLLYGDEMSELFDDLEPEVREILESLGVEELSLEMFDNIGISDVFNALAGIFKGSLKKPAETLSSMIFLIILTALAGCYISSGSSFSSYFETVAVMLAGTLAFSSIINCIHNAVSSVYGVGIFMKALIPIMAGITTAGGNPSLAVSYNSVSLYTAEIITSVCGDFLAPIMCVFSAVAVCSSVNITVDTKSFLDGVKRLVNLILGFVGTVFSGVIALKDVLSAGTDNVSVKGIKFILGSSVPVVGGAVSEGLSSVISSITLMKNVYGMAAIIILSVTALPAVCELLLWMICLSLASYAASSLGQTRTAGMLSSLYYVISILFSITVFIVYMSVISTAMVILLSR
ncbi:MAG: stage III sporulation protein AE [Clostridiales bacterium]|nr:stage III sporulation protein AE [Clostridiales bacterium]MCD7827331.1 stage III sporulation protein AE [Clostridiales bacterium]